MGMVKVLLFIALIFFITFIFVKYLERKNIYYPLRDMGLTPREADLKYSDIFFTTDDKVKLNAWFIKAHPESKTVLFCHGNAGNISHRLDVIELLNGLGLNVFIFDYRGYGRSEGSPSEEGLYRDTLAAYNYLRTMGVSEDEIIVYGKSLGSAVAVDLASKVKVGALIVDSGFTTAADMARVVYPFLPLKWALSIKYDSRTKIARITVPKLFIHSRDDEIIPLYLGKQLFEAAPEPKEFLIISGDHNEAIFLHREQHREAIEQFLKEL